MVCSPLLSKKRTAASQRGFGLIELLVSISILVLVLTVILVRQDSFNSAVLLRSQAYEIAFRVREVQLYAVSAIGGTGGNFRQQYGVHFDSDAASNRVYYPFADAAVNPLHPENHYYNASTDNFGPPGIIDPRFEVRSIALFDGATSVSTPNELSVVFERPNFDALFFTQSTGNPVDATEARIQIAVRGLTGTGPEVVRTLVITKTGQISVE